MSRAADSFDQWMEKMAKEPNGFNSRELRKMGAFFYKTGYEAGWQASFNATMERWRNRNKNKKHLDTLPPPDTVQP